MAAAAALLAVPALSACGVSFDAQTDQVYTPADGENDRSGSVDVLNVLIVSDTPGSGRLIAGLVNNSTSDEDELSGVRGIGEDDSVSFTLGDGETTIPAGGSLQLADEEAAIITASGSEELLAPGTFVRLEMTFEKGEPVTLNVPVLAPGTDYDDLELESEGAEPTESSTELPSATPSESPSESPTEE